MLFDNPPSQTRVLIVGSGPSGLSLALFLARQKIHSIIVTRYPTRLGQPKAHAVNPRTIEILRQAGFPINELRRRGSKPGDAFWVRFNLGLAGAELGKIPYERQDEAVTDVTPEPLFNIPQPIFEDALQEAVLKTGFVTIYPLWSWEAVEFSQDGSPISLIRHRKDNSRTIQITSEYLIGADGTESSVRSAMRDVQWLSHDGTERQKINYCSIHARGDLSRAYAGKDRRGQLSFCLHPEHSAAIIVYDSKESWVFVLIIDPEREPRETFSDRKCKQIILQCIGPDVDVEILSVNFWYTWPRVASTFSDSSQHIHLVGDSAHSFPPQGGLGINTGIGDAHNLAWKLGITLRNRERSCRSLLSTYSLERRRVAVANSVQSVHNEALWIEFHACVREFLQNVDVSNFRFHNQEHKIRFEQILSIERPHFDMLALHLGYTYDSTWDVPKVCADSSNFEQSSAVGARLPHAWLANNNSTLDLIPDDKFALLHAGHFSMIGLSEIERKAQSMMKIIDVEKAGAPSTWTLLTDIYRRKGMIVRPDQHILAYVCTVEEAVEVVGRYCTHGLT